MSSTRESDEQSRHTLFNQLKNLQTEQQNPDTIGIDLASSLEIAEMINREDAKVADAVNSRLPQIAEAIEAVRNAILNGGRLFYFGAGTSGRLGVVDAAEIPPTFGTSPELVHGFMAGGQEAMFVAQEGIEDRKEEGVRDLASVDAGPNDVVCGLAASGRTPYVHGAIEEGNRRGCTTIFVTTVSAEHVSVDVDVMIDVVVGPEAIMGSTRMKSATAQKMVLGMISTGAMVRLGKVYENVMVDLMLSNDKLKERAKRIVMLLGDVDYEEADRLLGICNGHVKTALMMALAGLSKSEAEEKLATSEGFIRRALQE
ncbi:MAG: N-acetylmuramic acid 6-phosphate etherase [Balneolaceae bacterium]